MESLSPCGAKAAKRLGTGIILTAGTGWDRKSGALSPHGGPSHGCRRLPVSHPRLQELQGQLVLASLGLASGRTWRMHE